MNALPLRWLAILALACLMGRAADNPIRVLLVTGGHDYETNQFVALFESIPDVSLLRASHPQAHEWLKADRAKDYDVLVLYDMWSEISEAAKADFVARLNEGKGLVALHHSLASYPKWDEYTRLIGGRYHLAKRTEGGVEKPASTYLHDVDFKVRVANTQHPVTAGLQDFDIHDETYGGFEVRPDVDVLLSTSEPTSGPNVAWARRQGEARVVYIQLGHDHAAYENPSYRRLVTQAIRWTAKR